MSAEGAKISLDPDDLCFEDEIFWLWQSLINLYQGFGREEGGNRGKFIGSNIIIFCYKEFEKFALCKSASQSEATFIVYSEPVKYGYVKNNFS